MTKARLISFLWLGALPLSLTGIMLAIGIPFFYATFFLMAFYWNWALVSYRDHEKVESRKYRFSSLRLIYRLHNLLETFLPFKEFRYREALVRSSSPAFFCLVTILIAFEWQLIFTLAGSVLFETLNKRNLFNSFS